MGAVVYRLRRLIRSEWRTSVWLGLLIALATGTVLLTASGAHRTATAPDRYTSARGATVDATVTQEAGRSRVAELAALPGVASVESASFVFGGLIRPGGTAPLDAITFAGMVGPIGAELVAGREPDAAREGEFAATRSFLEANDAELGDTFELLTLTQEQADRTGFDTPDPAGPTLDAVLVGVLDSPDEIDFPTASTIFAPALLDVGDIGVSATIMTVDLQPGADLADLRGQLDTLGESGQFTVEPLVVVRATIRTAVDAQAKGLWLLAGAGAVATVAVLGQLLSRRVRRSAVERSRLPALGFDDRQLVAEAVGQQAIPIIVGVVAGAGLAAAASGVFPTGFVRRLEPDPGPRIDATIVTIGALALLVALVAWTVTAVVLARSSASARLPSPVVEAIAARSGGATAAGVRFAFTRRPHERGSVRATVIGVALIIAAVVGALTFAMSLDRLVDEPARWGQRADLMLGSGGEAVPDDVRASLEADDDVAGLTVYAAGSARVGNSTLGVVGFDQVEGDITAPVLAGRVPAASDEIALGRLTADDLDVGVGDELTIDGATGPQRMRVTGVVVVPPVGGVDGVGEGALVPIDSLGRLDPTSGAGSAVVGLRPGAGSDAAERLTELTGMATGPPTAPPAIVSVARIRTIPFVLAALLGALAVVSVGHVLLSSVQGRRRDLAVLRALGADRSWVTRVVHSQATAFTIPAVVVGVPLGLALGRLVFTRFADGIGTVRDPVAPLAILASIVVGVIVLANAVAAVPARRARRLRHADSLRVD